MVQVALILALADVQALAIKLVLVVVLRHVVQLVVLLVLGDVLHLAPTHAQVVVVLV